MQGSLARIKGENGKKAHSMMSGQECSMLCNMWATLSCWTLC